MMGKVKAHQHRHQQPIIKDLDEASWYLEQIECSPSITLKEECQLIEQLRFASASDKPIIQRRLVEAHLPLAVRLSREQAQPDVSFPDLIQQANVLLLEAAEAFNPNQKVPFRTYAKRKITSGLTKFIRQEHARLSEGDLSLDAPISQHIPSLTWSTHAAGASENKREASTLADTLAEDGIDQQNRLKEWQLLTWLNDALAMLSERNRQIIMMHYGLGEFTHPIVFEEIGKRLKLTRERIRQREVKAIKSLRASLSASIRQDRQETKRRSSVAVSRSQPAIAIGKEAQLRAEAAASPTKGQALQANKEELPVPVQASLPIEQSSTRGSSTERHQARIFWGVPSRNPYFTGRQTLLEELEQGFLAQGENSHSPIVVLTGIAGVGKTEIAAEYAQHHRGTYDVVLWLDGSSLFSLENGVRIFAERLGVGGMHTMRSTHQRAFRQWLQTHKKWLLVVDGITDSTWALFDGFLPDSPPGDVILTARLRPPARFTQHYRQLAVPTFSLEDALLLLLRRAMRLRLRSRPDEPMETFEQGLSGDELTIATTLANMLERHPLALDQAAAFLGGPGASLANYLHVYKQRPHFYLGQRGTFVQRHEASVIASLAQELREVEQRHAGAGDLLRRCASLADAPIAEKLLTFGIPTTASAHLAIQNTIEVLVESALLSRDAREHTLRLPALVRIAVVAAIPSRERDHWEFVATKATFHTAALMPSLGYELLGPHIRQGILVMEQHQMSNAEREYLRTLLFLASQHFSQVPPPAKEFQETSTQTIPEPEQLSCQPQDLKPPLLFLALIFLIGGALLFFLIVLWFQDPTLRNPLLTWVRGVMIGIELGLASLVIACFLAERNIRLSQRTEPSSK
jgi:RNA polymerase sigma factor (sigma-70 family)